MVFPALHGPFGEDGTVQGLFETIGLPYVGSGVLGSSVAMDKDLCKNVLRGAGIVVAPSLTLRDGRDDPDDPALPGRVGQALGWPVFVKPASLGSSVGISRVAASDELAPALRLAFAHDEKVLVEAAIVGREIECGVLGNAEPIASAIAEIVPRAAEWYDYAAKYEEGGSEIVIPADLDPAVGRAGARDGARRVPRVRVRGHGADRLLPAPVGRARAERGQHDPRLHAHVRVRAALRGTGPAVRRIARPPDRARARASARRARYRY